MVPGEMVRLPACQSPPSPSTRYPTGMSLTVMVLAVMLMSTLSASQLSKTPLAPPTTAAWEKAQGTPEAYAVSKSSLMSTRPQKPAPPSEPKPVMWFAAPQPIAKQPSLMSVALLPNPNLGSQ